MDNQPQQSTVCECESFMAFTSIKSEEELAIAKQKFQQLVDKKALSFSHNFIENNFDNLIFLCPQCGKDFIIHYLLEEFRGYYGPVYHPKPLNDKTFTMKSVHLLKLRDYLIEKGQKVCYNGDPWYSKDSSVRGNWVGFTCCFDEKSIRQKLLLPDVIIYWEHYDIHGGSMSGFSDESTGDVIYGPHPLECNTKIS